jgi:two-component system cell cycle sensor histidine kinase/response regulator CckA
MELSDTPSAPTARQVPDPATSRVLVVDDDPTVLELTARILRDAGYVAVEAPNAREALRLLERGDPPINLVITDVVIPETDGRALGRLIGERHSGLPVVYMSAYPVNDIFHRGSQEQVCRF